MLSVIFPCHPLDPRQVDPSFAQERDAFRAAGHPTFLVDTDALAKSAGGQILQGTPLPEETRPLFLYRGWMLPDVAYGHLHDQLDGRLLTSPADYLASHHLPGWHSAIADLTIPSEWGPADRAQAHFAAWQAAGRARAFVKDYVKSVKTGQGSGVTTAADLSRVMADMVTYKGFIEGGVVLREWVDLDEASEVRFFVWQGRAHAPHDQVSPAMQALAEKVARRHPSLLSAGYPTAQAAMDWAAQHTMEDLHVMKDTKGVFHLFRHGEEVHYRKHKFEPVAEITVDRQVIVLKDAPGKPVKDERNRGTHDGFRTVQDALDWLAARGPENIDIMRNKQGELHPIRDGYQDHYRGNGDETVATVRIRSLVTHVLATLPVQDKQDAAVTADLPPAAQRRRRTP
jgi:hypothetical protein